MLKTNNRFEVIGKVRNFKVKKLDSGKQLANITVRVDKDGHTHFANCTLFDRETLKYGNESITLNALKNIFPDTEGKSLDKKVHITGTVSDYAGNNGTRENLNVNFINPSDKEDKFIFNLTGFVNKVNEIKDEFDDAIGYRVQIGMYRYWGKGNSEVAGVQYKTVVVDSNKLEYLGVDPETLVEKASELEIGDFIQVYGRCLNELGQRDEYGNEDPNSGINGLEVVGIKVIKTEDDIDEDEAKLYKNARKLKSGETIKIAKTEDEEEEDLAKKLTEGDE